LTLYKNKYRVESSRCQKWDYGSNGKYFITIVTKNRNPFFGGITFDNRMILSEIGKIAQQCWLEIPDHFSFVKLDQFVVMPDHFHGVISIEKKSIQVETASLYDPNIPDPEEPGSIKLTPGQKRFRNPEKNSISSIVGAFKSAVSRLARQMDPEFGWQSRFHDHIIRDKKEFKKIERYIKFNPKNWKGETLSEII